MQVNRTNMQLNNKPSFNGNFTTTIGKKILSNNSFKKFSDKFEYDKFNMSLTSVLVLLYGATIVPRYLQATDKHDKREILTRDLLSITAILFFAKALSKGFSRIFSKTSGFVLNNLPTNHEKAGVLGKLKNYLNPEGGIDVLTSQELSLKYSNLKNYKNGITDFFKFVDEQKGDVRKIFSSNKIVRENANKIVGKDIKTATIKEVEDKFAKAKDSVELKNIYKVFENPNNSFVRRAKTMNSAFNFTSLVLLVPAFMIWIEKFNEKTTKRKIAEEQAKKAAAASNQEAKA